MGKYLKISNDPYRNMVHFEPNMDEFINSMDDDEMFEYAFSAMGGPEFMTTLSFKQVPAPDYTWEAINSLDNPTEEEKSALMKFFGPGTASIKGMAKEEIRTLRKVFYKIKFKQIEMTTTAQEDASWEALFGKDD